MAVYFNLKNNEISKELLFNTFNMILDNQGSLVLIYHSITSPGNETQKSRGFVLFQNSIANSSDKFGIDETFTECKVRIFSKRNNLI